MKSRPLNIEDNVLYYVGRYIESLRPVIGNTPGLTFLSVLGRG